MSNLSAFVGSDLVVVDYNPEFADYDNPRGAIYRESYYVYVEDNQGARWKHVKEYVGDENAANRYCSSVNRYLARGGELDEGYWHEIQAAYGSDAYVSGGWEQVEIEREREEACGG